jgi:hypothetical protein
MPEFDTCDEIIRAEYGGSRNPLTPHVLTCGGVLGKWAAEVAHGDGITSGTSIVGLSVVLVTEDGTERCFDLSRSFHGDDTKALIDEALAYMKGLDIEVDRVLAHRKALPIAERLGREAGEAGLASGSWMTARPRGRLGG